MTQLLEMYAPAPSRLNRLIRTARLETPFANLPAALRRRLARRRDPWFRHAVIHDTASGGRYELASAQALNCIFVHVPKTAGLSVSEALFDSHGGGHVPLRYYLWLYGPARFDAMFKFTFLRDPVARAQSAYQFLKAGGLSDTDAQWAQTHAHPFGSFDDFVLGALPRPEVRNALHFRPQVSFLIDPRTGAPGMDFIGRVETIEADFAHVSDQLGTKAPLPHTNSSGTRQSEPLSPEALSILQSVYAADYALLAQTGRAAEPTAQILQLRPLPAP